MPLAILTEAVGVTVRALRGIADSLDTAVGCAEASLRPAFFEGLRNPSLLTLLTGTSLRPLKLVLGLRAHDVELHSS